jgi:hypothetical protein
MFKRFLGWGRERLVVIPSNMEELNSNSRVISEVMKLVH